MKTVGCGREPLLGQLYILFEPALVLRTGIISLGSGKSSMLDDATTSLGGGIAFCQPALV